MTNQSAPKNTVILLHGLGRTSFSMLLLKSRLESAGFHVIAETYPSRDASIEEHAKWLASLIEESASPTENKLHFVTHSLGGIIVRQFLSEKRPPNLGRTVMISPPNKGSKIIDYFHDSHSFEYFMGPAAMQLGTDHDSKPNNLGPADFELGVIAGNRKTLLGNFFLHDGDNDGLVSVESTKLEGMRDFLEVENSHTFIMNSKEVAQQVIAFLVDGKFMGH